jgi:hypothetical protein
LNVNWEKNCQLLLLLTVPTCMSYWSIKLLVSATLVIQDWVGWSCYSQRHYSKFVLNVSTLYMLIFLLWEGSKMNSLLPLMPREHSLTLFSCRATLCLVLSVCPSVRLSQIVFPYFVPNLCSQILLSDHPRICRE